MKLTTTNITRLRIAYCTVKAELESLVSAAVCASGTKKLKGSVSELLHIRSQIIRLEPEHRTTLGRLRSAEKISLYSQGLEPTLEPTLLLLLQGKEVLPGIEDPTAHPPQRFYLNTMSPKYNNDLPMITQLIQPNILTGVYRPQL
jgi:hypothetical protein